MRVAKLALALACGLPASGQGLSPEQAARLPAEDIFEEARHE